MPCLNMARLKWSFKRYSEFLKDYGFVLGHINGSHHFYNGKILGEQKVVQVIFSSREKGCQSNRTIDMGIKNSGIPKKYFEEWNNSGKIHDDIIY